MKMKILYFSSTIIKTSVKIFFIALLFSSKSYSSTNYCDFEKAKSQLHPKCDFAFAKARLNSHCAGSNGLD